MKHILTYAWRTLSLGITAYALVHTRDVPQAYADTIVDTDCSTDLNQPNTTYRLTTNVPGSCVIAADNIILDGQNLYTITGNVNSTTTIPVDFTVQNVTVGGDVHNNSSASSGNLTIQDVHVGGGVEHRTFSGGATGILTIIDSQIDGNTFSYGYYAVGTITVTNSVMGGNVNSDSGYEGGAINITNSTTTGLIHSDGYFIGGSITVQNSHIGRYISSYSVDSGYGTQVTISNSFIAGSIEGTAVIGDTCIITDSTLVSPRTSCNGGLTLINNPPTLTVTPLTLSLAQGEVFNPFSGVSATDAIDGDLSGEVNVVGSVEDAPGTYELVYSVSDSDGGQTIENSGSPVTSGPSTATTTRTVTRTGTVAASETESSSQATWVGHRSGGGGPTRTTDTVSTTSTTSTTTPTSESLDATLAALRTVLAQPIATTDTTTLAKLVDLLSQLLAVLVQLMAKGR